MKVLLIGDTHFGASNSSDYFLKYQEKYFERLLKYMLDNDIHHMIHLGDLYDNRKSIYIRTLKMSTKFFTNAFNRDDMNVWIIIGNHDTVYKNTVELNTVRELLYWTRFHIVDKPEDVMIGNASFLLVPWICDSNIIECMEAINNSPSEFCAGHFEIEGFQYILGAKSTSGLNREVFSRFDTTFSGHYHAGSYANGIYYVGSPYELTWADYNDKKRVLVLDTETKKVQSVTSVSKPIFYKIQKWNPDIDIERYRNKIVKVHIDDTVDRYPFDKWFTQLMSVAYRATIVENSVILDETEEIDVSMTKDTLHLLFEYVDSVYGQEDEATIEGIKRLVKSTYQEACSL